MHLTSTAMLHARPTATLCALLALFSGCTSDATSAPPGTHVPVSVSVPAVYTASQEVHIEWGGTWYAGHVLEVGAGETAGQYKIHYDGWADSWDTWVTPDKLRLPSAGVATGSRPS